MVTIKYFPEILSDNPIECEHKNIASFLKSFGFNRDELIDLCFFHGDTLGKQIDTSDVSFLEIDDEVITIIHRSQMPHGVDPISIAVVAVVAFTASFVASVLLAPSVSVHSPDQLNQKQQSTTNSLNRTNNEFNINGRIDDIFGTVVGHVPNLLQVPYRIGINNQEAEVLFLLVGRGKYDYPINSIRDSETPYQNIPNAQVNVYGPGTWPGNGSPETTINGLIDDQPLGIYRESSDLNSTELLPPNDLSLGANAIWSVTANGTTATLTLVNQDTLDISLEDYNLVGATTTLLECWVPSGSSVTLDHIDDTGDHSFATFTNISGDYEITAVTENTVTVTGFPYTVSNQQIYKETLYNAFNLTTQSIEFWTNDTAILTDDKYETSGGDPVNSTQTLTLSPDVGQNFDNIVGPFNLTRNVTRALVNLSSPSGFYKIDQTTYKSINASVTITVEETDENNNATGELIQVVVPYSSHPTNRTSSVYQSIWVDIPGYEYSRIYARRTTNRDKGEGVSNVDKINWVYLYTYEPVPETMDLGNVTTMHCVMVSNSQSRLIKERRTKIDLTRKITQYLGDGEFGPAESYATDDAFQIAIHTALDAYNGRLTLDQLDAETLMSLRDEVINYFGSSSMIKFGYDFDDNQFAYDDMFRTILDCVNCIPFVQYGQYTAFFERQQSESSMQVTCRNKVPDTESRKDMFEQEYDGIELTYRSNDSGVSETIYVPDDGSATNARSIDLSGCTTELQAQRRAWREYNKLIYKKVSVEFTTDEFARNITPGRRLDSPDGTRFVYHDGNTDGYRVYSGEVVEVNGLNVELSEPVQFEEGEDHYIQFTKNDGTNSELILCTPGSDEFSVVLAEIPTESLYDGYERDRTKFMFMSEQLRESVALLPETIEFKLNDGVEQNTITLSNYTDKYYENDLDEV